MLQQVKERKFDKKNWKPVICGTISCADQVAGFKELETGDDMFES